MLQKPEDRCTTYDARRTSSCGTPREEDGLVQIKIFFFTLERNFFLFFQNGIFCAGRRSLNPPTENPLPPYEEYLFHPERKTDLPPAGTRCSPGGKSYVLGGICSPGRKCSHIARRNALLVFSSFRKTTYYEPLAFL